MNAHHVFQYGGSTYRIEMPTHLVKTDAAKHYERVLIYRLDNGLVSLDSDRGLIAGCYEWRRVTLGIVNQIDANKVLDARRLIRNFTDALTELDRVRADGGSSHSLPGCYVRYQGAYDALLAALTKC